MKKKDQIPFQTLLDFFSSLDFTDDIVDLNPAETIIDIKTFVESHIAFLKGNKGNKVAMPYYHRLVKLYKMYNP
jgi:hypothetical protein